ncbi:MAG: hypothetical protein SGILL_001845 [Bacillariaceae sp.]
MISNFFMFQPTADALRELSSFSFEGLSLLGGGDATTWKSSKQLEDEFSQWSFEQRMAVFQPGVGTPIFWDPRGERQGFSLFFDSFKDELDHAVDRSDQQSLSKAWKDTSRDLVLTERMCTAASDFQQAGSRKKHVALMHFDENWGAFSGQVPNRTSQWGTMRDTFGKCASYEQVLDYLDHPNTLAVVTTQFQGMDHPKVHSIPLGISGTFKNTPGLHSQTNRTQLLMINFSRSPQRRPIADTVIPKFNGTLRNTYGSSSDDYVSELLRSKFFLSPSGMGWDCYRHWEGLIYGAIPIIEHYNRTDGWYRVFDGLPVLWVSSFDEVTPELLASEYSRLSQLRNYTFKKLTSEYWIDFVYSLRGKSGAALTGPSMKSRDTEDDILSRLIALRITSESSRSEIDAEIAKWQESIKKDVYDILQEKS